MDAGRRARRRPLALLDSAAAPPQPPSSAPARSTVCKWTTRRGGGWEGSPKARGAGLVPTANPSAHNERHAASLVVRGVAGRSGGLRGVARWGGPGPSRRAPAPTTRDKASAAIRAGRPAPPSILPAGSIYPSDAKRRRRVAVTDPDRPDQTAEHQACVHPSPVHTPTLSADAARRGISAAQTLDRLPRYYRL